MKSVLGEYPNNWKDIAQKQKERANWTCQHCGKICRKPGESIPNFIARYFGGDIWLGIDKWGNRPLDITEHPRKWMLTVAHRNHQPADCSDENLIALCLPCHGRMDLAAMPQKLRLKQELNPDARQLVLHL
ncbi:MAG: HNH endonuclease [Leptolyngbyaceae cyanobacterium MO_188.B28]|nr:HNH endonuclease [Leptolyngbyaceae cyanobacterium MO_188.B28]